MYVHIHQTFIFDILSGHISLCFVYICPRRYNHPCLRHVIISHFSQQWVRSSVIYFYENQQNSKEKDEDKEKKSIKEMEKREEKNKPIYNTNGAMAEC